MNLRLVNTRGGFVKTDDLWIEAVVLGRWVMAKVYNEPSTFGINNGRVSKLSISKTDARDPDSDFFEQMAYNYDRGLDFDDLDQEGLLEGIVDLLEKYRKSHMYDPND
jgi:hypothetical protein